MEDVRLELDAAAIRRVFRSDDGIKAALHSHAVRQCRMLNAELKGAMPGMRMDMLGVDDRVLTYTQVAVIRPQSKRARAYIDKRKPLHW